ncbi:max-interacting protein 1 isoform X1 [Tachysurus ichikawai]
MAKSERQKRDSESGADSRSLDACPFSTVFGSRESSPISTFLQNVQVLLQAASYIDRAERKDGKCEHGYASTFPSIQSSNNYQRQRKFRNKKHSSNHNRGARAAHQLIVKRQRCSSAARALKGPSRNSHQARKTYNRSTALVVHRVTVTGIVLRDQQAS